MPHSAFSAAADVEALKCRIRLSEIVARDVDLRRAGHEFVGLCPFHAENTPSFWVNDAKGVYFCFGCTAAGDLVDYVRQRYRLSFREALMWLGAETPASAPCRAPAIPAPRVNSAAISAACAIWRRSQPVAGTPAEAYLRRRGICTDFAMARFAHVSRGREGDRGGPPRWTPALVVAAQDVGGRVTGIQRICLTPDGRKAGRRAKLSLGVMRGSALRLGPPAVRIMLCEGPEDGMTIAQMCPGTSVWVSLGAGNLHRVELPSIVRHVTIAGDNDAAGRNAAERAVATFAAQGRGVDVVYPPRAYRDWNDQLMGVRSRTAAAGHGDAQPGT